MPDKLTDAEVKKALECCVKGRFSSRWNCTNKECPYYFKELFCVQECKAYALAYINQLEAEVESLKTQNAVIRKQALAENKTTATAIMTETKRHIMTAEKIKRLKEDNERLKNHIQEGIDLAKQIPEMLALAKVEAYKEYSERIHCRCESIINQPHNEKVAPLSWKVAYEEFEEYNNNLLNELVGDGDAMNERIKSFAKSVCSLRASVYYDYSTALNDYSRMQEVDNEILSISSGAFCRCFSDIAKQICYTKPAKNADTYCVLANKAIEMLASGISEADTLEYFDKVLIKERKKYNDYQKNN